MQNLTSWIDRLATTRNLMLSILLTVISISVMAYGLQTLVYDVYGQAEMPDTNIGYTCFPSS